MRGELIDSVNVRIGFIVRTREETDSAFNQIKLIVVGIQCGRIENRVGEVVNEVVIGVVSFGAVDDYCLQIFIPRLRFAEEFAQVMFGINGIKSEAVDELFGNVFVNVVRISVAEIIFQSRPDIGANEFFEIVHRKYLQK